MMSFHFKVSTSERRRSIIGFANSSRFIPDKTALCSCGETHCVSNSDCPFALKYNLSDTLLGFNNGVGLNGRFPSWVFCCSFGTPFLPIISQLH